MRSSDAFRRVTLASAVALCVAAGLPGGAASAPATVSFAMRPIYSGNGRRALPPFCVSSPSTLRWRNFGSIFHVFPKGLGLD